MRRVASIALSLFILSSNLFAQEINVLSWNLESIGSDPQVIAEQLVDFDGYELMGLSEVDPDNFDDFLIAAAVDEGAAFDSLRGTTGGGQRLMLVWNADRFERLDHLELLGSAYGGGRAPLAVKLRDSETGHDFWFMVNHLHRASATKRNNQAADLKQWIQSQSLPVLACGDWNMDWDLPSGPGNAAFDIITEGNHVRWVEPSVKIKTQSSNQFNSILDFFFINDDADAAWAVTSRIIQITGEFLPTDEKSPRG